MSFSGSVMVDIDGGKPLQGCWVEVYRFSKGDEVLFVPLTKVRARTDKFGKFNFEKIPVLVEVRTLIHNYPPYDTYEVTRKKSLPNLVFRISFDPTGSSTIFEEIYDERGVIKNLSNEDYGSWKISHWERFNVDLSGMSTEVLIPKDNAVAVQLGEALDSSAPAQQFHFLRVGRVTRDEIGEMGSSKPGYMNSSATSFFKGVVDAPFGGTLNIGGAFGGLKDENSIDIPIEKIYYTVSVYKKDPITLLPGTEQIIDRLINKRYIYAKGENPGKWETLDLGPFDGSLEGNPKKVHKLPPPRNDSVEYWPFHDLIVLWNSADSDGQCVLSIEAYERIGGSDANPQLKKIILNPQKNDHLLLEIDNHPPVPKLLPFNDNPAETARKFSVAYARYLNLPAGASQQIVDVPTAMDVCNEMEVAPAYPDGNKCILMRYSVEDGQGNPHKHLSEYRLYAEFTPKAVKGGNGDSIPVALLPAFAGYEPISGEYSPTTPPIMMVNDFRSVVVPAAEDGWPPQKGDTAALPDVCRQYAVEVGLSCSVRTIDGWGGIFGTPHVSRHIIIKRS